MLVDKGPVHLKVTGIDWGRGEFGRVLAEVEIDLPLGFRGDIDDCVKEVVEALTEFQSDDD